LSDATPSLACRKGLRLFGQMLGLCGFAPEFFFVHWSAPFTFPTGATSDVPKKKPHRGCGGAAPERGAGDGGLARTWPIKSPSPKKFRRNIARRPSLPCMQKDQGIVKDERGQDQPKDKKRAQQSGLKEQQSGLKEQREAAEYQPPSPGEPAKGE
jgi:hypothetical protein